MKPVPEKFKEKSIIALKTPELQEALAANKEFACSARQAATANKALDSMKEQACKIKDHVLEHLSYYLEQYEKQAKSKGIIVHWAETATEAQQIIRSICKDVNGKLAVCGKSMIGAEIDTAGVLSKIGVKRYETDLGEYILQLAGEEPPSHVTAPAMHKTLNQIRNLFNENHKEIGTDRLNDKEPEELLKDVRKILREKFLCADIGIIGANFLIAETGANVLVSNEGNADLCTLLPKTNIILASIEKVLPRMVDAELFLRLLCLSATGQQVTSYQSFYFGKKENDRWDGARQIHIILLDNGRSNILNSKYRPILRCIRCAACMDNCPVYNAIGGHPYGWIYPGPMGVIWTTQLTELKGAKDLIHACTLNGHCSEVCPMKIPLKDMIRTLRVDLWDQGGKGIGEHFLLGMWGLLARNSKVYHWLSASVGMMVNHLGGQKGYYEEFPCTSEWMNTRDMPAFRKMPFSQQLKMRQKK